MSPRPHMQEILSGWYLGVHLGYKVYMFSAILSNARMFSKVVVPVSVSTCSGWKCPLYPIPFNIWWILVFSRVVNVKWHPIVIFIIISLIAREVGYLFMCLWAICVFIHSKNSVWVPPLCQTLFVSVPLL